MSKFINAQQQSCLRARPHQHQQQLQSAHRSVAINRAAARKQWAAIAATAVDTQQPQQQEQQLSLQQTQQALPRAQTQQCSSSSSSGGSSSSAGSRRNMLSMLGAAAAVAVALPFGVAVQPAAAASSAVSSSAALEEYMKLEDQNKLRDQRALENIRGKYGIKRTLEGRVQLRRNSNGNWMSVRLDMEVPGAILLRDTKTEAIYALETDGLPQVDLSDDYVLFMMFADGQWEKDMTPIEFEEEGGGGGTKQLTMTEKEFHEFVGLLKEPDEPASSRRK